MMNSDTNTALLIMDVQQGQVSAVKADESPLIGRIGRAIEGARLQGIPIFFVTLEFRDGHPEVDPQNRMVGGLAQAGAFKRGSEEATIYQALAPEAQDIVVRKVRVSAFSGSDLEIVLRAQDIDTLILTGISTGGVVLSTVREAADKDFRIVVLADGCFDPDPEVHSVLTEKIFPRQTDVLTVDEWVDRINETSNATA
jgi:nicotinamidase-related amidase